MPAPRFISPEEFMFTVAAPNVEPAPTVIAPVSKTDIPWVIPLIFVPGANVKGVPRKVTGLPVVLIVTPEALMSDPPTRADC